MSSPSVSKKDEFVAETFDEISQSIPYKTGSFVLASWKYYQSLSFYMKVLVWVAAINMIIITMIVVKKLFDLDQETFTHIVVSGLLGFIFAMTYMISFLYDWV
jgi:positive regulator of sigma E activity